MILLFAKTLVKFNFIWLQLFTHLAKVLATTNSEPGLALKQLHYGRALFIPLIEVTSSSTSPDGRSLSGRDLLQNLCIKIDPNRLLITFDVVRILSLQEK